jgi:CubicO group peptidase (beta-lactamase class C family)
MTATLSTDGLARLHDAMAAHVEAGDLPGLTTLVARGDEVHIDTIGTPAFTDPHPLRRDAIYRLASLVKPLTAVTALSLVEDGVLRLDQSIEDLIPELANRSVLRSLDAELDDTVPAKRAITVEDLLTFRLGIGTILAAPGTYPFQRAESELGLQSIGGPPWPPVGYDTDGWIAALGTLPLIYQPGEQWLYSTSAQVLGVLITRATGMDLDAVMRERVLDPLGMRDTGFTVPAGSTDRLTTAYSHDPDTGEVSVLDDATDSWWSTPPPFPDGAGWGVSTIDDFWAFVSMLLGGGTRNGVRVLMPETVARMTTDHLTPEQRDAANLFLEEHGSWGFGMTVPAAGTTAPLPYGIGWDGGIGTTWRSNPTNGVTGILFTQRAMNSPEPPPLNQDFWAGVNAAIVD